MKRKRIGIYFLYGRNWLGGVYYIQNLLIALSKQPDETIPFVDLYCSNKESFDDLKSNTQYPYLEYNEIRISSWRRWIYLLLKYMGCKSAFKIHYQKFNDEDIIIYPYSAGANVQPVFWIPDFQEKYLPQYFSKKELSRRDKSIRAVAQQNIPIVFSSEACLNDYKKFYPEYNNKTFVVRFSVFHPDFSDISVDPVKEKYGITKPYLLCANQFWTHKNHLFLFKAFKKALDKGLKLQLVCTGRMSDPRNPGYIEELKDYLIKEKLDDILLLGLIDRKEQLCLLKNSYAVVQPSLFEGWNTTVEDCKALDKFVFLSDLPVHREQMNKNVCFFDPYNEDDLVQKLLTIDPVEVSYNYSQNLIDFESSFVEVINMVEKNNK